MKMVVDDFAMREKSFKERGGIRRAYNLQGACCSLPQLGSGPSGGKKGM
jgi:hypothetical protein